MASAAAAEKTVLWQYCNWLKHVWRWSHNYANALKEDSPGVLGQALRWSDYSAVRICQACHVPKWTSLSQISNCLTRHIRLLGPLVANFPQSLPEMLLTESDPACTGMIISYIYGDKCCSMLFIIVASISVKAQFTVMARCWRIVHSMYCCYCLCSIPVSEPYWSGIFTLQNQTVNTNLTIPEIWTTWDSLLLPPPTSCFSSLQNHKKSKVSSCFPPKLIQIVPRDSCARIRRSRKALGWFTQAYDFGSRVPAEALNLAITYNLNV